MDNKDNQKRIDLFRFLMNFGGEKTAPTDYRASVLPSSPVGFDFGYKANKEDSDNSQNMKQKLSQVLLRSRSPQMRGAR